MAVRTTSTRQSGGVATDVESHQQP